MSHIEQAKEIAIKNYNVERNCVHILPPITEIPDLTVFIKNALGVAALDEGRMLGYLCCLGPFENAFGSTNAIGIYSPIYGNGALQQNREQIYALMYQGAAEKWVNAGTSSHAIAFYAHNTVVQEKLFRYGFGLRCIDAIRPMEEMNVGAVEKNITYKELETNESDMLLPLNRRLENHLEKSPMFMKYPKEEDVGLLDRIRRPNTRYFIAQDGDSIIAYMKISNQGESFISQTADMKNITGAYCLPEYRGRNTVKGLLNYTIRTLKNEKYGRLGVDYESFNPQGSGFWLKHFTEYTHGVVRRIDDRYMRCSISV
jgi:hypothetical protein